MITLTAAQRDALYENLLLRLSGIGDVLLYRHRGEDEKAALLEEEYRDALRLFLDDLSGKDVDAEEFDITTSPEILRRVLPRLREAALAELAEHRDEVERHRAAVQRCLLAVEACDTLLGEQGALVEDETLRAARIGPMVAVVREAWERHPEQRLGQLISDACRNPDAAPDAGYRDPFHVTDEDLWRGLERARDSD